jgi:hypothetical protein
MKRKLKKNQTETEKNSFKWELATVFLTENYVSWGRIGLLGEEKEVEAFGGYAKGLQKLMTLDSFGNFSLNMFLFTWMT